MRLKDRVAVVTGGAKGIGRAIAERFLREGASVVVADIAEADGRAAETELKRLGPAAFHRCNVAERLDIHNLVAGVIDRHGRVDVLVNNAGIIAPGDILELSEADFDRVLAVNLRGAFLCAQAVARRMVAQVEAGGTPGTIINMSSVNAELAIPNQLAYCVSKGGLQQLTRAMALALAPHGIRVNAIGPGSIMTDVLKAVANDKAATDRLLSRTPLGRIGEPDEIAGIAAFLASDDAAYVTGQTVFADGGRMALNYTVPVRQGS